MQLKLRNIGDSSANKASPSSSKTNGNVNKANSKAHHGGSSQNVDPATTGNQWEQIKKALASDDPAGTDLNGALVPLVDANNLIACPDCSKPILESALDHHKVNCAEIRKRAAMKRSAEDSSTSPSKKPKPGGFVIVLGGDRAAAGASGSSSADDTKPSSSNNPKKKSSFVLKNELASSPTSSTGGGSAAAAAAAAAAAKAKASRAGPVDVDKQCGVINDKGLQCSRSLTCKSHSMGAKRSVPHRSQPYDILLHEWQKATKPGFKADRPVQPRVGPGSEGVDGSVGGPAGADDPSASASASAAAAAAAAGANKKKKKKGTGEGKEKRNRDSGASSKKGGITIVGEYADESDGEQLAAAMGGNHDEAVLIDSDEEVEGVFKALGRVGRGRALTMVGGGGAGFSAASMFVGRNSKLAKLGDVLGGVFSFTPPA